MDNFIDAYIRYREETEPQYIYHRWCAISVIAALLGRNFYLQHGNFRVFPNLYCMLLGESGTRKSTAIKLSKKLLSGIGYDKFSADKTSKEKFLLDLEGLPDEQDIKEGKVSSYDAITEANLWGSGETNGIAREVFIVSDEFNEFIGAGNLDFCSTLGNLWDWDDEKIPFKQRLKNSRSVSIWQPTVNILGGNTPENYARAFPPEIMGQGFLRRLLHIHGERSGRQYTFPPEPSQVQTAELLQQLQSIQLKVTGKATIESSALEILDAIYKSWNEIPDIRFKSYSNSRFTQLLKLCLIIAAADTNTSISRAAVIHANTTLAAAEQLMPKALGEFGKSKNSDVANKLISVIENAKGAVTAKTLWKAVQKDLEKPTDLSSIMQSLQAADRVQWVKDHGWLLKKEVKKEPEFVEWSLLTTEEQEMM